jgi:outer membrane protein TolC
MLKPTLIFLLLLPFAAGAQESLSLDSAIAKALRYNYDIRISDITAQQAAVNNTPGNAGLLPNIGATVGNTYSNNSTLLQANDGNTINRSGFAYGYSAGLNLNWTIFAAGRAYLVRKQLTALQKISEAQFKAQVQATVSQVIQAYALTVYNHQQITALDTSIELARARMELSQAKFEIGTSAKVDYLQGRVDFNASRSQLRSQEAALESARASLNALMGEDETNTYDVADSLILNLALEPTEKDRLRSANPLLEAARINADLGKIETRIARTFYFPTIDLSAGYNYNYTNSQSGQFAINRGFGPTGGLGVTIPIFQGGNVRRQVRVASLQALSDELAYGRQNTQLSRDYRAAWSSYQTAVSTYRLEEESIGYARENLDIQKARFRVGIATSLELREAENSYVQVLARKNTAAYNVKVNETRVLELESRLAQ